jgi:hypothetical protein
MVHPDRISVGVLQRTSTSSLMRRPSRDPRREMSAQLEEAPRVGTPASKAAVEECYRAEHARLWRSLLLFSGDADLASDAVSEAFTQALHRGTAIRDLRRWVWRAAFAIARGGARGYT